MYRNKEHTKKVGAYLKLQGNISRTDRFFDYINGNVALPDILIIAKDCKYKHGLNGKTVRRRLKTGKLGICLRCERNRALRKKNRQNKDKNISPRHMDAMNLYEEQNNKPDDLFLI